jgi:sulfate-transporting ATPase
MDAISGFTPATGRVMLLGRDITSDAPHRKARQGLGRTFQGLDLYEDLTVEENVAVGRAGGSGGPTTLDALNALGLQDERSRPVHQLSQGQRQLVSVARAVAADPTVLLLDEPAAGLDPRESHWLGQRLCAVRDLGVTIVLVDHDMGLVMEICDELIVHDLGRVIAHGRPSEVRRDPLVAAAYLGSVHDHLEASS